MTRTVHRIPAQGGAELQVERLHGSRARIIAINASGNGVVVDMSPLHVAELVAALEAVN